ncbi:hypothetical protein [Carboxylicivirga taeanensis]|uniref:hypothetical protein n=1 Tax=Carboxylicivirga taeanensis TaxID=1416875 RepID=UPI003F6E2830
MKKLACIATCLLMTSMLEGQTQKVWLHGKVVTHNDERPIPLAQIASYKTMQLFAADSLGEFKLILDASDSLKIVALGFEERVLHLDSLNVDPDRMYLFPLKRISYQIQQVDINSNWHYSTYQERLRAMRSKQMEMDLMLPADIKLGRKPDVPVDILPTYRNDPSVLTWVFQPTSALYYYTSKSERQKRKMLKVLRYEKQRQMMTVNMLQQVSGLTGDELETFILYCNAQMEFTDRDTPQSIKYKVMDLFDAFKNRK